MKRLLLAGSVVMLLLLSGCSQKSTTVVEPQSPTTTQPVAADSKIDSVSTVGGGGEGFLDLDRRTSLIKELESQIGTIYFDFDKYNIRGDMESKIDTNADILSSERAKDLTIKIEGNCDEWGTDEYNYALGLKRAVSVRDALVAKGINKDSLLLVSYGESNPVCKESNAKCWNDNRRVEIKLLP